MCFNPISRATFIELFFATFSKSDEICYFHFWCSILFEKGIRKVFWVWQSRNGSSAGSQINQDPERLLQFFPFQTFIQDQSFSYRFRRFVCNKWWLNGALIQYKQISAKTSGLKQLTVLSVMWIASHTYYIVKAELWALGRKLLIVMSKYTYQTRWYL